MSLTTIAVLYADARRDFFGAPGRLLSDLAGRPALAWTLERLAGVEGLDGVVLAGPPGQRDALEPLAQSAGANYVAYDRPEGPAWRGMRAARAFGRYGWRGGLAGTTVFDECWDGELLTALLDRVEAGAVLLVPAGAALLDVAWTAELLRYARHEARGCRMVFNQGPVGLGGMVLHASVVRQLAEKHLFPGSLLAYSPGAPVLDPIGQPHCRPLPQEVVATDRRFLADGPRGHWLCSQLIEQLGPDADGLALCRAARAMDPEPWPRELTVELTTRRPVSDALRPGGDRADLPLDALRRALAGLEEVGDVNVMLAGAGDALLHGAWPEAVAVAGAAGAVGLATYGLGLDAATIDRLIEAGPDVVQVYADAVSDALYARHKSGGSARQVWAGLEALVQRRDAAGVSVPMVVPSMLKTPEGLAEQFEFLNRSLTLTGWGSVAEPAQSTNLGVARMAPPTRGPCRRLASRLTLLSDGRLVACEDGGASLAGPTVLDAWRGQSLADLRTAHAEARWHAHPACAACDDYHRP